MIFHTENMQFNQHVTGNSVDRDETACLRADDIGENSHIGGVFKKYSVHILFKAKLETMFL